jgi:hypothetical protein
MNRNQIVSAIILIATGTLLNSCRKNNNMMGDGSQNSSQALTANQFDAVADNIYTGLSASVESDVMMLNLNGFQNLSLKSRNGGFKCRVVSIDHPDTTYYPKIITIDYGSGCSVKFADDSIFRQGKIVIVTTNKLYVPGAQHSITFDNYRENNVLVEGIFKVSYIGLDSEGNLELTDSLIGGKLTINDTITYTRSSVTTFQWFRAPDPFNDTIFVNGFSSGINTAGQNYSNQIVRTLKLVRCTEIWSRWVIVEGEVVSTVGSTSTTTNYSNTGCLEFADITQGGKTSLMRIRNH